MAQRVLEVGPYPRPLSSPTLESPAHASDCLHTAGSQWLESLCDAVYYLEFDILERRARQRNAENELKAKTEKKITKV